jgi:hypothetical protein
MRSHFRFLALSTLLLAGLSVSAQDNMPLEIGGTFVFAKPGDGARSYLRTSRSDYAKENFQAEVTVTLKGGAGAGCAFFGMGCGQGNARQYQEPSTVPSLFVRLAPSDFSTGVVTATVNGHETSHGSAPVGDGTHRVRFTWDPAGKRALFEVDAKWDGRSFRADSAVTVSAAEVEFGGEARLFVGGANGVKFTDFSTKLLTDDSLKAAGFGESFANDPTAKTWLPVVASAKASTDSTTDAVDDFLKPLHGQLRLLGCWYNGSRLAASRRFANGQLQTQSSQWSCELRCAPVVGETDALDLTLTFALKDGAARSAGVAVVFDFANWSTNNYVLIPASVYNGNRNRIEDRGYCTGFNAEDFYNKDLPVTHGDVPRLALQPGQPSKIEVSACNASTPAICFFNRETKRAFIVLAEQGIRNAQGEITDHAFSIEESADRSRATCVVSAPGVRERQPAFIAGFNPSPDRGINWKAGDEITLRLRVYSFETPDIPGLLEKFMTVRKAVTGPNHPRQLIPFSEVNRLMTLRIDSHWRDGAVHKYYSPENSDHLCLGWVGGLMNTFPMLALGDEFHRARVMKTFDFVIPAAQGKSGYFLAAMHGDGKASGRDWFPNQPIVLTRQDADVLYWMMKQLLLLKAQGHAAVIKPAWEQSVKRLAQAFVNTWQRHGQWGNYVNHETGDIAIYNSTSGAMAIGGLALAAEWFKHPEFLRVAQEAADYYYQRDFVQKGFTFGACSDIMQNADHETSAGLMTSLMALHEVTSDQQWLEKSRHVANLLATWVVSYDYELPKNTELGRLGAKLAGVVWASTQNKHGAPGLCTSSGDPLFKIYRATGNRRYAGLMRDIVHAQAEGIKPGGEITERLTYCDADSRGSRGSGSTGWCELNGILMAMELPGIYLRTDKDELLVFDHVEAKIVRRDVSGVTLSITNPTKFPAAVAVFAEAAGQARQPLGTISFLKWPKVEVKARETRTVQITPEGQIR